MNQLVLSLFPGIGLLDMAFEEAGFCVVRGPDVLWGGDVKRFHPPAGVFQGVIGGPPCQAFSRLRHMVEANGYTVAENLIPEYERVVREAQPSWFLMENVPDAPEPIVAGYAVKSAELNNRWVGGEQNRKRRFSFGVMGSAPTDLWNYLAIEALEPPMWMHAVVCDSRSVPVKMLGNGKPKRGHTVVAGHGNAPGQRDSGETAMALSQMSELQGLPADFLDKAPFTIHGKRKVIGNGVPLPMGRAIANAVREATNV